MSTMTPQENRATTNLIAAGLPAFQRVHDKQLSTLPSATPHLHPRREERVEDKPLRLPERPGSAAIRERDEMVADMREALTVRL